MKYLPKGPSKPSSSEAGRNEDSFYFDESTYCFFLLELSDAPTQPSLLLIVKWGGQLTQNGKAQAEALGKVRSKPMI